MPNPKSFLFLLTSSFLTVLSASIAGASDGPILVDLPSGDREVRLTIDYALECGPAVGFGAVRGEARLPDHVTRFDLYLGNARTELILGRTSERRVEISLDPSPTCRVRRIAFRATAIDFDETLASAVTRYSPYFIVRKNQKFDRDTDVPLAVTTNVFRPAPSRRIIQYSLYYTDEDSKRNVRGTESQMARYGRRLDIQWAYRVEIDAKGRKLSERFQGGILRTGIGHANLKFRGHYLSGTDHPILYDISNNNAYSDHDHCGLREKIGYLFADIGEIPDPVSREAEMFRRPWMVDASDREIAAEGKLNLPGDGYLYVLLAGAMDRVPLVGRFELPNGDTYRSGGGAGNIDRLGEDAWGREAFTAIPVGRERLAAEFAAARTEPLRFRFETSAPRTGKVAIERLRFFVYDRTGRTAGFREVSNRFACAYPKDGLPSCGGNGPLL